MMNIRATIGQWTLALLLTLPASCSKKELSPHPTANLTIVHAIAGGGPLACNFTGSYALESGYTQANFLGYDFFYAGGTNGNQLTLTGGPKTLALYQFPDTLATDKPLLDFRFNLLPGSINSLYLTGTVTAPDTMLIVDHIPIYATTDSVTGIRFVNLSPGSDPISINLQGQPAGSEIGRLSYKGITDFKRYAVTSAVSSYIFEFRDAASGNLLATYEADGLNNNGSDPNNPVNTWRFRNSTLALLGLPNVTGYLAQTILLINNY